MANVMRGKRVALDVKVGGFLRAEMAALFMEVRKNPRWVQCATFSPDWSRVLCIALAAVIVGVTGSEPNPAGISIRLIEELLRLVSLKLRLCGDFESHSLQIIDFMERETGFEPATSSLGSLESSATEAR